MAARRQVSIFINGQQVANQIKAITNEKKKLVRELALMEVGSEKYNNQIKEIRKLDVIIDKHRGNIKGVESAWDNVTKNAKQFFSVSNLAGVAAMAGITIGAQEAVQAVAEIVEETKTLRREISQTTGAAGKDLDTLTVGIKALSRTFNTDQREVLLATNTLVKEFGESYSTALDEIGRGFLEGANVSGEFLENIREYSTQFRAAGFSAKEFVDIAIRAQREGIFSDKGLDVIKEFGLRIREQTTATTDALDAAFGKQFTDKLFKGINDGSITTAEALKRVASEMNNATVPANRLQTVIADVFGGPGEDAGLRFIQILGDVQTETDNTTTSANQYAEAQRELLEANQELAFSENELTKQLTDTSDALTVFWTNLKTGAINILVDVLQFFEQFTATLGGLKAAFGFVVDSLLGRSTEFKSVGEAYRKSFLEGLAEIEVKKETAAAFRKSEEEAVASSKRIEEQQKKVAAAREKARKEAEREAERELQALLNRSEKLKQAAEKFAEERRQAALSEGEKRLEVIRLNYQKEIDEAIELEQSKNEQVAAAATEQRIELERLQAEALKEERDKIAQEELDAMLERLTTENEARLELEETQRQERADALAEIKAFTDEALRADAELELERLQEQGQRLLELAASQGEDVTLLKEAIEKKKADIDKKAKAEELKREEDLIKAQEAITDAKLGLARDLANGLQELNIKNEAVQKGLFLFQKGVAIAEIIINLQREIAAIAAANAILGPAGIALTATQSNLARIRAGIGIATVAATAIQGFTQKKKGGYATVRGEDDGQIYHARLIGQPDTGLLDYPGPVLTSSGILANEVGKEYYVSHSDLRNPKVLNHVQAIENITRHRQMQTGGFAPVAPAANATAGSTPPAADPRMNAMLDLNIQLLQELLRRGVHVQLDDNTLIAMQKRMGELVKASGGRVL